MKYTGQNEASINAWKEITEELDRTSSPNTIQSEILRIRTVIINDNRKQS